MKIKLTFFIPVVVSAIMLSCKAQSVKTNGEGLQTWYTFDRQGEIGSCTIYENKMVFNSLLNSENEKGVTEVIIEKRLNDGHLIIRNDEKSPPYAVISLDSDRDVLKMTPMIAGTSVSEAEKNFKEAKISQWISLKGQEWYSKTKMKELENSPGLDKLTREDLLASLQWREPLSEKLQQYLEDANGERAYMIYRFVENFRNQKLVALGYNPYKQVVYNLHEQFKDDSEIMALLTEDIKF